MNPPNRSDRQQCWSARDAYFQCLDQHGILSTRQPTMNELLETINRAPAPTATASPADPSKPPLPADCQQLLKEFHAKCLSSWVQHFEQTRERQKIMAHLEARNSQQQ